MLDRAQLPKTDADREPRTTQFVIERACPIEGGESPIELPYDVWVYLPAMEVRNYIHEACDSKHWRLTNASARKLGIVGSGAFVCEYMWYLIE